MLVGGRGNKDFLSLRGYSGTSTLAAEGRKGRGVTIAPEILGRLNHELLLYITSAKLRDTNGEIDRPILRLICTLYTNNVDRDVAQRPTIHTLKEMIKLEKKY